jgi:hypothetical protein
VVVRHVARESGEPYERVIGQIKRELETFVFLLGLQFELRGQHGPNPLRATTGSQPRFGRLINAPRASFCCVPSYANASHGLSARWT